MVRPTEGRDISKLPKWAQDHIRRLREDNDDLRRRLSVGPEGSDTFAVHGLRDRQPLGKRVEVDYQFGERESISVRSDGAELAVHGSYSLIIVPQASNHFRVRLAR